MQVKSLTMILYGVFLIVAGVVGYLSNPEKAATALISGASFGSLAVLMGLLLSKGAWRSVLLFARGLVAMLLIVFTWRASVTWMAVLDGASDKTFAAALISSMLAASIVAFAFLLRRPSMAQRSTLK